MSPPLVLTIVWSMAAAACLTLGLVHTGVWLRHRQSVAPLWFSVAALAAALNAMIELWTMRAGSVEELAAGVKVSILPVCVMVISLVWFVVVYFGTARRWLAWALTVLWGSTLAINLVFTHGILWADVSGLRIVSLPWGERFAVVDGDPNPWNVIAMVSAGVLVIFAADASIALWRRGNRRRAGVIGGSIVAFFVAAGIHSPLVDLDVIPSPYLITFAFLAIIVAMAFELSADVVRASELSREVSGNERRWRSLLEHVRLLVVGVDRAGRLDYVNPFFTQVTGFSAGEVLGRPIDEIVRWEHGGSESLLRTRTGEERVVIWSNVALQDGEGVAAGVLGVGVDVTDRRKAEGARDRALQEVDAALQEVRALKARLEEQVVYLEDEITSAGHFGEIVGESQALQRVLNKVVQVAPLDTTVLIEGETGVGKELFARAIHARSPRKDGPMVKVNCAALPAALIEAELFGHERGAFTGAVKLRRGRFELADGGTILLDEVTELSQDLQGKLLRVLQEGEIERIGGDRTIKVDVRVIAATNRRLGDEVARGRFRQDLYYRLHVYPITVPPLRRRKEDIPVLASAFVRRFALAQGKAVDRIPRAVLDELVRYDWPGNVRELQNVIEQAVITTRGRSLRLAARLTRPVERREEPGDPRYEGTLDEIERRYIRRVLDLCGWRIEGAGKAAELLGLHPNTLRFRMAKLGIRRPVPGPASDQVEPADGQPDNEPRHAVVSPHVVASAPGTPADRIGRDV